MHAGSPRSKQFIETHIRVRVAVDIYKKLGMLAALHGLFKRDLVALAINEYVRVHESELEG